MASPPPAPSASGPTSADDRRPVARPVGPRKAAAASALPAAPCRCCGAPLSEPFAALGMMPCGAEPLSPEQALLGTEAFHPLDAFVCSDCRLVQLAHADGPWLSECREVPGPGGEDADAAADAARLIRRLRLGPETPVVEVGSGRGARLEAFARAGLPVLGVEPCAEAAREAVSLRGVATEVAEFGAAAARRLRAARPAPALMLADGLLPGATDLHDAIAGLRILLAPGGVAVLGLPHLLHLMRHRAFDAIGHDRPCIFSLLVAELVLSQHGLTVFDAEEPPAAPGTLRLHLRHAEDTSKPVTVAVERLRTAERAAGLEGPHAYARFAEDVVEAKCALLDFLAGARRAGLRVAGAGAPPRAATLLNYCGVGPELLPYIVDPRARTRAGLMLPGRRIPVLAPETILTDRPDFVLVLSWDRREEAMAELAPARGWGGRFVVPLPSLQVL